MFRHLARLLQITITIEDVLNMNAPEQLACIACGSAMDVYIDRIWDDRYGCPGVFAIERCASCGQMATTPRLLEQDLPALYSTYYPRREIDFDALEREAALVTAPYAKLKRWLNGTDNQGHYLARPGQKVLDIGSGSCLSLLELRKVGIDACGVEADPNVRAIADRYGLRVHIGSIHDHPFVDEVFDLIVLNQVIEHVPEPQALLECVKDRLAPDGKFILSFPNAGSWARMLSGTRWINWHVPYHQHHFNKRSFELLANQAGFRVVRARTITPNLWTLLQIKALSELPQEGQASSSWSGSHGQTGRTRLLSRIKNALRWRLQKIFLIVLAALNRLVDALGKGDSLLIELRKN